MTALPAMPFPGPAHLSPLVDAPTDHRRRFGLGEGRQVHRFPAATFLDRAVAREELAVARDALAASDRTASRRLAGLGTLAALLLGAMIGMLATGHGTGTGTGATGFLTLWGAGAGLVVRNCSRNASGSSSHAAAAASLATGRGHETSTSTGTSA